MKNKQFDRRNFLLTTTAGLVSLVTLGGCKNWKLLWGGKKRKSNDVYLDLAKLMLDPMKTSENLNRIVAGQLSKFSLSQDEQIFFSPENINQVVEEEAISLARYFEESLSVDEAEQAIEFYGSIIYKKIKLTKQVRTRSESPIRRFNERVIKTRDAFKKEKAAVDKNNISN